MLNRGFKVSIEWLEEAVFPANDMFFIKNLLHRFVVSLFSVERESLKLVLILRVVKNCLWKDNIGLNTPLEIIQFGPSPALNLHGIEHISIGHFPLAVIDIFLSHCLQKFILSFLKLV